MKIERLKIASMVMAFMIVSSCLALAHDKERKEDRDRYHGSSLDARQHGYEHGYREGALHGREDRERRVGNNVNSEDYKKGDHGYEKFMGNKGEYKKGYREGYKASYNDAYNGRSGRFGDIFGRRDDDHDRDRDRNRDNRDDVYADRRWGSSDVAYDMGYRDGVTAGQQDRERNKTYNLKDTNDYRNADHGYRSSYGDKEAYKRQYREGSRRGYQDGYGRYR